MSVYDPNGGPGQGFPPGQVPPPPSYPAPPPGYPPQPPADPAFGQPPFDPNYGQPPVSPVGYGQPFKVPKKYGSAIYSIVGILVVALAIGIWFAASGRGGSLTNPTTTTSSQPTNQPPVDDGTVPTFPRDLNVGDCFLDWQTLPNNIDTVGVLPCSQPHEAEVYYFDNNTTDDDDANADICLKAFTDYIGVEYKDSQLNASYITTTKDGETVARVTCIVYDKADSRVTFSYKDSKR